MSTNLQANCTGYCKPKSLGKTALVDLSFGNFGAIMPNTNITANLKPINLQLMCTEKIGAGSQWRRR